MSSIDDVPEARGPESDQQSIAMTICKESCFEQKSIFCKTLHPQCKFNKSLCETEVGKMEYRKKYFILRGEGFKSGGWMWNEWEMIGTRINVVKFQTNQ